MMPEKDSGCFDTDSEIEFIVWGSSLPLRCPKRGCTGYMYYPQLSAEEYCEMTRNGEPMKVLECCSECDFGEVNAVWTTDIQIVFRVVR